MGPDRYQPGQQMGITRIKGTLGVVGIIAAVCMSLVACTPGVEIPDDPTPEQVDLWIRMAELAGINEAPLSSSADPLSRRSADDIDVPGDAPASEDSEEPTPHEDLPLTVPRPAETVPPPHDDAELDRVSFIASEPRMGIGGCPIYPINNAFHADITGLDTLPESDQIIAAMGDEQVSPPSSKVSNGIGKGIPVNLVDSTVDKSRTVVKQGFLLQAESLGKFPMPSSPRIQGYPGVTSDQHLLLFDKATCRTHEFFLFRPPHLSFYQTFEANSAYTLDVTSNEMPRRAATVSAISMIAGMIRYDEVEAGSVNHVLVAGVPNTNSATGIWPAAPRTDGPSTNPYAPKIGQWLRLKDIDTSTFGPKAKVIIRAMQTHGVVIHDTNHGRIALGKENDSRWDDEDMKTLRQITAADFEVVDASPMMVSRDSYEIR